MKDNEIDLIFKITAKVDASEFDFKPFDYEEDNNEQNNILQFLIQHNEFWVKIVRTIFYDGCLKTQNEHYI